MWNVLVVKWYWYPREFKNHEYLNNHVFVESAGKEFDIYGYPTIDT